MSRPQRGMTKEDELACILMATAEVLKKEGRRPLGRAKQAVRRMKRQQSKRRLNSGPGKLEGEPQGE